MNLIVVGTLSLVTPNPTTTMQKPTAKLKQYTGIYQQTGCLRLFRLVIIEQTLPLAVQKVRGETPSVFACNVIFCEKDMF